MEVARDLLAMQVKVQLCGSYVARGEANLEPLASHLSQFYCASRELVLSPQEPLRRDVEAEVLSLIKDYDDCSGAGQQGEP